MTEDRVDSMIAGTSEVPECLRALVAAYHRLDGYLVDPKKLVLELNSSLVTLVNAANAASIEIPVVVLLSGGAEVPDCLRAAVSTYRLLYEYLDHNALEVACNKIYDALKAGVEMIDAFALVAPIMTAIARPIAQAPPAKIHAVPANAVPGLPRKRA